MFGLVKGESQPFFLKLRSLSSSSIPSLLLRVSIFIHHQVSIHPFILMNHCVTCNPHFHPCFSMLKHIPDLLKSVLSKASASPSRSTAALGVPAGSEKKSAAQHWPGPLLESLGAVETFSQWIGLREKLQVNPRFLPWHMDFSCKKNHLNQSIDFQVEINPKVYKTWKEQKGHVRISVAEWCKDMLSGYTNLFVSWEGKTIPMKSVENTEQVEPPWRFATRWCHLFFKSL